MLYRHFDKKRRLLYVGISHDALQRAHAHGKKEWGHLIVKITVEHFATRAEAEVAEKAAIISESPRFNIQYAAQLWLKESRDAPLRLPTAISDGVPKLITVAASPSAPRPPAIAPERHRLPSIELDLKRHMFDLERSILEKALRAYNGNQTKAGRRIGLSLRQMRYRMGKLDVSVAKALIGRR